MSIRLLKYFHIYLITVCKDSVMNLLINLFKTFIFFKYRNSIFTNAGSHITFVTNKKFIRNLVYLLSNSFLLVPIFPVQYILL